MKVCIDLLDRAGFKPVKRQETHHVSRTVKEIKAELLLGKKKATVVN